MRLLSLALVCVPLMAHAEDELDIPGLDATDLRGDALIWEDAPIYLEPWEGGTNVYFNRFGRRREEVGKAMPVRIIDSTMKNFVEITVPGRSDCAWRRLEIDNRIDGLRLFVKREDLAPVLIKPWAMQWSDGTKLKLGIGMPVTPTTTGDYLVALRDDKVRAALPHASVGYIYKAGKIVEPEIPKEKVARLDYNANVKLGDDGFSVRSRSWYGPMPEKRTDVALLRMATKCAELTVSAPTNALRLGEAPRPYVSYAPPEQKVVGWRIPPGTPLMTPAGREVAVAAREIAVTMPAPAPEMVCFDAKLTVWKDDQVSAYGGTMLRTVKLCASGSAVTQN